MIRRYVLHADTDLVKMSGIYKSFPGVLALDDVSFHLKKGEVMALLGENGAGKSTLVKIISGVHTRDQGSFKLFGKNIEQRFTPKKASELGVSIIHQELNMCAHLTVAQNIFLGKELCKAGILDNKEMNLQTQKVLDALKITDIHPHTIVGNLPISKQQMVEIAKAIHSQAKVLIMDEPTSALTNKEIDELFEIILQLRAEGVGIIYISHRLDELHHIVDRVTIMRDGKLITEANFSELSMDKIITHMVGREIKEQFPRVQVQKGKKIFSAKGLNSGKMVQNVSFEAYEGEILGIAGLMGAGRTELTRAIFGADPLDSGSLELDGKPVTIHRPQDAIGLGIVLAPEDRKKDGLCIKLSIKENLSLPNLDFLSNKFGVINRKKEKKLLANSVQKLSIKMVSGNKDAASLSGGNQQKLVVAKWLARESRVVIFDEPTRGIDIAAKVEIYNLMNQLKESGKAVIFVSSELPEILGIADRILVMSEGRITAEFQAEEATQEKILAAAMLSHEYI
ncbi:sugar ABC transporter ATP-binding protein [Treponema phagedenis]|uniref:sugar ABC transporter ATP-binding protein n=1 Tax=Treponema phagedenis TaxID=162 RepID=UPI0005CBCE41|nr:sugar ABC transporter ATP-binding protein [Treponema phagedenis]QSH99045.1 sugar ABC transporter ATP-binding protein [Treponema phagedenis]